MSVMSTLSKALLVGAVAARVAVPDGPKAEITAVMGCGEEAEMESIPVVWGEGVCQPDPMSEKETMILQCVKDGSLWVRIFDNGNCEGQPEDNLFLRHNEDIFTAENEFEDKDQCHKFLLDEMIRDACEGRDPVTPPTNPPTNRPLIRVPVQCRSTGDPHFAVFQYAHENGGIRNLLHAERYFDFQDFGEFNLWGTDGLDVQVRHGSRLDMTTTTVSTNNAIAIGGTRTCDVKYEIYGDNGYWMRAWLSPTAATPVQFFGKANVLQGIDTFAAFQNCAGLDIDVDTANSRIQFTWDDIRIKVQLSVYGIDIWIDATGPAYLPTDTGICPKSKGWNVELDCNAMFTNYPNDDCPSLPRQPNDPINVDACDPALREEAEAVCDRCPDEVLPEECVREVCGSGTIEAAADLLKTCTINTIPIRPQPDVHCYCTGDPHCMWFDGLRQDFQSRGEFVLYETTGAKVMVRQGYRPDIKQRDDISTNHAVAIEGKWTCGYKYEFFHDDTMGQAVPHWQPVPMLKVTNKKGRTSTFLGMADILAELAHERHECANIATRGSVIEFVLNEDAMRVRVQQVWWGINVWVDVKGRFYLPADDGMCTRKTFDAVPCEETMFTEFPNGDCDGQVTIPLPPQEAAIPPCDAALEEEANQICNRCPDQVDPKECVWEACTIGTIDAAHEMLKACEGTPVAPVPQPTLAPVPDVYCSSYNDPHFRYFDNTSGDNMNRGHFQFYKTAGLEIQTRQGPYLTLAETHPNYNTVSTNNAMVFSGDLLCGAILEIEAFKPTDVGSKKGMGKMTVTKDGQTTVYETIEEMTDNHETISDLVCGGFSMDPTYAEGKFGPIFIFEKSGFDYRWQVRPHGVNIWINVEGVKYLSSDSGMCTKRGDWERALDCDEILFTTFPDGHTCEEEKGNDQTIAVPVAEDCDPQIVKEATEICNRCPDIVAPQECVTETCLLGAIEFAEEQTVACGLAPQKGEDCGKAGAIRKKGKKVLKTNTDTACECENACVTALATEWQWKAKKGRCVCFSGSKKVVRKGNAAKRVVGVLPGSVASETN